MVEELIERLKPTDVPRETSPAGHAIGSPAVRVDRLTVTRPEGWPAPLAPPRVNVVVTHERAPDDCQHVNTIPVADGTECVDCGATRTDLAHQWHKP